ncbi:hypothetical protein [uncultured Thiodictyon sp.]|uniref:hypothetical protein n=1 Tax=uncultured Thiodictyon sp. TaxID=1846217 RepID=UPI0025FD27CA|nr:hypothetical protein [uncultured Thiodictyon sp.]
MNIIALLLLIVSLAGCATTPAPAPVASPVAFSASEYAALPKSGNSTITGQAFLKKSNGDIKVAAGNEIRLNPVTSYSLYVYNSAASSQQKLDPRCLQYRRTTIADSNGRFRFKNIPAGDYFVSAAVKSSAATGRQNASDSRASKVIKRVAVGSGGTAEVMVRE